jgi:hypothetical protein
LILFDIGEQYIGMVVRRWCSHDQNVSQVAIRQRSSPAAK